MSKKLSIEELHALMGETMATWASPIVKLEAAEETLRRRAAAGEPDSDFYDECGCTTCGGRTKWSVSPSPATPMPAYALFLQQLLDRGCCPTCRRDGVPYMDTFESYLHFLMSPCEPPIRATPPRPAASTYLCRWTHCRAEVKIRRTLENTIRFDVVAASYLGSPPCPPCLWLDVVGARFDLVGITHELLQEWDRVLLARHA